jgi:archaellum biogenesis ATPase FlaH
MAEKKINNKEIVLRQWFAARYGNRFDDHASWKLPKGIAEMNREYSRDNPNMPISFNFFMYKIREIEIEVRTSGGFQLFEEIMTTEYVTDAGSFQKFEHGDSPVAGQHVVAAPIEVELNIQKLDNMDFPTFRDFPTDTVFDRICSDDDELRGMMSGMVVICTGESGVGKSTLIVDVLAKMKKASEKRYATGEIDKPIETLYVSTEMTKTDLYFYHKKMPAIGKVNTLLVAEYLKRGLKEAITKAFRSPDYDVILLDSYQDLVEKMQDALNWRSKEAENFIIQLMVEAAEEHGKCIIAIQHLTKGGEYVGRTFLKHTTTAMLELRFDKTGGRFAVFTKNRRGGSMTHVPMYFNLVGGEVKFDEEQFATLMESNAISKSVAARQETLQANFGSVFDLTRRAVRFDGGDDAELNVSDDEN